MTGILQSGGTARPPAALENGHATNGPAGDQPAPATTFYLVHPGRTRSPHAHGVEPPETAPCALHRTGATRTPEQDAATPICPVFQATAQRTLPLLLRCALHSRCTTPGHPGAFRSQSRHKETRR